jgi:hypothetical protein
VKRRWIISDKPQKELKKKLNRIVQREKLAAIPCSNNRLQNYGTLVLLLLLLFFFLHSDSIFCFVAMQPVVNNAQVPLVLAVESFICSKQAAAAAAWL